MTRSPTPAVIAKSDLPLPRERFDPWSSVSTGHQKDSNSRLAGSAAWRQSRTSKLAAQFRGGAGGGRRVTDSAGAGSPFFGQDGRLPNGGWQREASGLRRETGCADVAEMLKGNGSNVKKSGRASSTKTPTSCDDRISVHKKRPREAEDDDQRAGSTNDTKRPRKLFDGLCFYINGSTAPTVSDHRLKYLIAENGGRIAVALARKSVTHVVLGVPEDRPSTSSSSSSTSSGVSSLVSQASKSHTAIHSGRCGGGLSATKLQKEIRRVGGHAVKYVTAEWVLGSLEAGRRIPESTALAKPMLFTSSDAQQTLTGMFGKHAPPVQ